MSELPPSSNKPENPESVLGHVERYPTEQELREFEAVRNYRIHDPYPIEYFARDPSNPTEAELQAMSDYNDIIPRLFENLSFESYFGYPDPRKPEDDEEERNYMRGIDPG